MPQDPTLYPLVNACLNGLSAILLIIGMVFIRRGNESAHKKLMLSAFSCSVVFLCSYLYYHIAFEILVAFAGPAWGALPYKIMLFSHIVLAAIVPVLAIIVIRAGLADNRVRHRKWAKRLFPMWMYVSITGVSIYLILYVFTDSAAIALST
ncbi:MAG TPA: DUF420 domain-containing protein [Planctomycetes bacterium]|jgi:uncharacterized membrane protein YozB (DUF420 family)|nr:DUF420 domain-containing protein [Planctomycetota bacterium]